MSPQVRPSFLCAEPAGQGIRLCRRRQCRRCRGESAAGAAGHLISALAQGVIGGNLDWKMIGIGALVGVGLILIDAVLIATRKGSLPPLAVGIGIYPCRRPSLSSLAPP